MTPTTFWKNFRLGTELDIAGTFIFNGLRRLHEIESLYYEAEVFEVLYNLAVGIERLLKVAIILIEHEDAVDQEAFERSLITHTHQELMRRVQQKHDLKPSAAHNEFLDLLGAFYRTHRYGRYSLQSFDGKSTEKTMLHRYLEKHLTITIEDLFPFQITPNDPKIRKFVGKNVGTLTKKLYGVINAEASRLNIYTHEIRVNSKAEKIFVRESFDFLDEDVLWKEIVLFLLNSDETIGVIKFMKSLDVLAFDPALAAEYLQCLASDEKKLGILGELEALYEDVDDVKERLAALDVIGNPMVSFDADDSESEPAE